MKASGNTETEFAARLRKIATAPRPLVIRVEEAKGAPGFTADREGRPMSAPIFPTRQEVRDWLASLGYAQRGDDPDAWG